MRPSSPRRVLPRRYPRILSLQNSGNYLLLFETLYSFQIVDFYTRRWHSLVITLMTTQSVGQIILSILINFATLELSLTIARRGKMFSVKVFFILSLVQFSLYCVSFELQLLKWTKSKTDEHFQNGFKFIVKNSRNCENIENPIISLINSSMTIDENYDLFVTACSAIQPYKTALVSDFFHSVLLFIIQIFRWT